MSIQSKKEECVFFNMSDNPRPSVLGEAQPRVMDMNVKIVHTIYGGINVFDLLENSWKGHARESSEVPHSMHSIR